MPTSDELDRALKDLPSVGKRVFVREDGREVWRFEFGRKVYYLKFYPRGGSGWRRRLFGGVSPGLREFLNLQAMQKADVPAPRAVAHLSGFSIGGKKGDAVILEALEPSVRLAQHLDEFQLSGEKSSNHRQLVTQVIGVVSKLGQAKLGHGRLTLDNLLLHGGRLFVTGGASIRPGGMRTEDVLALGHSASPFATTTDRIRAWRAFSSAPVPKANPAALRDWHAHMREIAGDNEHFGAISAGEWSGWFCKRTDHPRRWAPASSLDVAPEDWQREWPKLLDAIGHDKLEGLKREKGGDVLAGEVTLGGRTVRVVVKRPMHNKWHRYVKELYRGLRVRQAWTKAWSLVVRDVPTAWPLLLMVRRDGPFGLATEGVMVSERVEGDVLALKDFDAMKPSRRVTLFHRLGRTLRLLESRGLKQYDSKAYNWVVIDDEKAGPVPVIVDVDGIRRWTPPLWPIERLLRGLREHKQYTPADSKWVCIGYAPNALLMQEEIDDGEDEDDDEGETTPIDDSRLPPHPNPLPSGERGPEGPR